MLKHPAGKSSCYVLKVKASATSLKWLSFFKVHFCGQPLSQQQLRNFCCQETFVVYKYDIFCWHAWKASILRHFINLPSPPCAGKGRKSVNLVHFPQLFSVLSFLFFRNKLLFLQFTKTNVQASKDRRAQKFSIRHLLQFAKTWMIEFKMQRPSLIKYKRMLAIWNNTVTLVKATWRTIFYFHKYCMIRGQH